VRVFVYGTLMPGHEAWPVLARWTVGAPRPDAAPGSFCETGRPYPGARFDADGGGVPGVVVEIDPSRLEAALAALDDYEGDEYARVAIRTLGGVDAYAYAWIGR
jgi:gamma-glutamylcyclotransferase (GGCT)/AIG2-like uncharacterized protein YtfP